jgi:acetyl esterase/lipase
MRRLFLVLAGFAGGSALLLAAALRFPEVLLDPPAIGAALVRQNWVLAVLGLLGLGGCGVMVWLLSRSSGALVWWLGVGGGGLLVAGAVATPVSLWGNGFLARVAFWCLLLATLVLAVWTVAIGRGRVSAWFGAAGLVVLALRSAVWLVNLTRPVVDGFWVASAVVTVLALLLFPLWVFWLLRMGLPSPRRVGTGAAAVGIVLAYAGVTVVTTPTPEAEDVPSVPSPGASAFYLLALAVSGQISPPSDLATLREMRQDERYTKPVKPAGATLDHVDANGVPADWICAPGASTDRAVLYLHGGGFVMPVSNGHREFAALLSRRFGTCVLLPDYRIAPEHPFPAPVEDTVHAFDYLRGRGIDARRTVFVGDSCGGTFALSAALMLRDAGDELPAALIALSGGFDLTVSGPTHRTKAHSDAVLDADDVRFSADSYAGGADPAAISPLFADLHGLPPTLLIAGTQDVLASDSPRLADRLREAGVPVRLEMYPGQIHDFPLIAGEIMESDLALRHMSAYVS